MFVFAVAATAARLEICIQEMRAFHPTSLALSDVSTPWLLADYEGSEEYAKRMLALYQHEDLISAWVLSSKNKTSSLPTHILNEVGLDFPFTYQKIAKNPLLH